MHCGRRIRLHHQTRRHGPAFEFDACMAVPLRPNRSLNGPPVSYDAELERVEIELLLEGVYRHYGFDFRSYAYASIRRRLWKRVEAEALNSNPGLQALVLNDVSAME